MWDTSGQVRGTATSNTRQTKRAEELGEGFLLPRPRNRATPLQYPSIDRGGQRRNMKFLLPGKPRCTADHTPVKEKGGGLYINGPRRETLVSPGLLIHGSTTNSCDVAK